jgi:hypothetical protein
MNADVVGFQEAFHEEAPQQVCKRAGRFNGAVIAPRTDGASGPRLGLAIRLPVTEPARSSPTLRRRERRRERTHAAPTPAAIRPDHRPVVATIDL